MCNCSYYIVVEIKKEWLIINIVWFFDGRGFCYSLDSWVDKNWNISKGCSWRGCESLYQGVASKSTNWALVGIISNITFFNSFYFILFLVLLVEWEESLMRLHTHWISMFPFPFLLPFVVKTSPITLAGQSEKNKWNHFFKLLKKKKKKRKALNRLHF